MSLALFLKEIKRNRSRFLAWATAIASFSIITSAMLPTMVGGAAATTSYLKMFPKSLLDAFGMDLTTWSSILGSSSGESSPSPWAETSSPRRRAGRPPISS
jgi:hypothetical protein